MNAVDMSAWNADWVWSLPLIVLNVVIHVIGLALIGKSVIPVLIGAMERHRFMPTFAMLVGITTLLATTLHGIEAAIWATAYCLLGALPDTESAMLYFTQRNDNLWSRWPLFGSSLATDGSFGGAERDASVRADHRLYVRRNSEGLAAGKQRTAPENGTCIMNGYLSGSPPGFLIRHVSPGSIGGSRVLLRYVIFQSRFARAPSHRRKNRPP